MYRVTLSQACFPAQADMDERLITIGDQLRETAAELPAAEALVEVTVNGITARRWTYAKMLADSERLAEALSTRFWKGERICIWSPNSPEWVMMEYACALAGLVLVTANPAFQPKELRYVLEQSGAVALFQVASFRGNPMDRIGRDAADGNTALREIVDIADADAMFAHADRPVELPAVEPDDPAQIQYTSGTTGFPKGAVLSHVGLVNNARFYATRCGVDRDAVWLNPMPMFHTSGCGMSTLGCLQAGARMVLISQFDPAVALQLIEHEKVTIVLGVPTMVLALLEEQEARPRNSDTLALVSCGGSQVAPELVRRVQTTFGCGFSTLYGQTEFSPVITQHHSDDSIEDICNSTGQPAAQTEVSIRRVADNSVADLDEVGEICARGISRMIGYHANPEATADTIDADGWLHTGDLGTMDDRGYVQVTGRVKEMIIRGGENHFPAEIENVLLEHPDVAEVAVVGIPDDKWGEVIGAFVRMEDGRALNIDDLRSHCRTQMSPQKTPAVWKAVEGFPLTGSGKIQKFALRDAWLKEQK
jgi:fatty-acyl-CoA synthase